MISKTFILVITGILVRFTLNAQDPVQLIPVKTGGNDTLHILIETTDGNEYSGILSGETDSTLSLVTEIGVNVTIPKAGIKSRKVIEKKEMVGGEYFFENPHATRYFYGPNGYGLRKNEGYYQNLWVMFNQVSIGLTDNFSMGLGVIPLFLFAGAPTPAWITPKVSFPVKKDQLNLGGGVLMATILGETESSFGIAYGIVTVGSRDKNISLGSGWAYTSDGFGQHPTFSLSGMYRTGRKGYIISENYLISGAYETFGVLSFGGRSVQKKLAVDYGLALPLGIEEFIAFPWLSITLPFGKEPGL